MGSLSGNQAGERTIPQAAISKLRRADAYNLSFHALPAVADLVLAFGQLVCVEAQAQARDTREPWTIQRVSRFSLEAWQGSIWTTLTTNDNLGFTCVSTAGVIQ